MPFQPHSIDVFFTRITKDEPEGCWTYHGPKCGGGLAYRSFRRELAHRFSYRHHKGEIPKGMLVRHTCDNPVCVNPDHLLLGTPADNMKDKVERGRAVGAKRGVANHRAKLTEEQVSEIRHDPRSCKVLGELHGVCPMLISKVKRRILWPHVLD